MRTPLALAAITILCSTRLVAQDGGTVPPTKHEVVFDSTMNKAALDQIRRDLRSQGIIVMYDDMTFGPTQRLQRMNLTVMDGTGAEQKAASENVAADWVFGFAYENVNGKNTVTRIGNLRAREAPKQERGKKRKKD